MTFVPWFNEEILGTTLRASVLIALLFALRPFLARWLPLKVLPWLWLVVAIKLLFISAPTGWWSLYNLSKLAQFLWATPEKAMVPLPNDIETVGHGPLLSAPSSLIPGWTWNWPLLLASVWLLGVALLAIVQLTAYIRFHRELASKGRRLGSQWQQLLNKCAANVGITTAPFLIETSLIDSPALVGLRHPQLLVPPGLLDQLDPEQASLVFLHELCHLRRRDLWLLTLLAMARTLHWFNPLVWLAERALRADCEAACDAEVLRRTPSKAQEYGHALLRLTELSSGNRMSVLVAAIATNSHQTERRLRLIMQYRGSSRAWSLAALVLVVVIGALTLPNEVTAQEKPAAIPPETPTADKPGIAAIQKKIKTIVLPSVNFNKASVSDVLLFLTQKSKELDPDHLGINFVLRLASNKPGAHPAMAPGIHNEVTIVLDNVPVEEVLKFITQQTNLQYSVEDYAVYLRPASDESETLTVRTYLVPVGLFPNLKIPPPTTTSEIIKVDVKDQLTKLGFLFPAGASATYLPGSQKLIVRNTPKQLDLIEKLIEQLSVPHPAPAGASPHD